MILTAHDLTEIQERTAQILADRIQEQIGDMAAYVIFPLSVASTLLSLSSSHIPTLLPTVATANGKHGVTLAAIKEHIASRTKPPTRKLKTERGAE